MTAMSLLKAAVKSTGEHKQKVVIKINLTGIVLVDASNQVRQLQFNLTRQQHAMKQICDCEHGFSLCLSKQLHRL